jgi:SAM-dependent methyltransferase
MRQTALGDSLSKFSSAQVLRIRLPLGSRILDMPCGSGRHARWLASLGYAVVGVDLDARILANAKKQSFAFQQSIQWLLADIEQPLPFMHGSFDLALVVHYVSDAVLERARNALRPGGYLVFETFDARGENWRALPLAQSMSTALARGFETLVFRERIVGPGANRAVVRAVARRTPNS